MPSSSSVTLDSTSTWPTNVRSGFFRSSCHRRRIISPTQRLAFSTCRIGVSRKRRSTSSFNVGVSQKSTFASPTSTQVPRYAWGNAPDAEALDALAQMWKFRITYAFPPPPDPTRHTEDRGFIRPLSPSHSVLAGQKWFLAILSLHVHDVRRLPVSLPFIDLTLGYPPLPHLPLLVWKISGGCGASHSPTPPSSLSAQVGGPIQPRAMTRSGAVLRTFSMPEEFSSFPSI